MLKEQRAKRLAHDSSKAGSALLEHVTLAFFASCKTFLQGTVGIGYTEVCKAVVPFLQGCMA